MFGHPVTKWIENSYWTGVSVQVVGHYSVTKSLSGQRRASGTGVSEQVVGQYSVTQWTENS